MTGIHKHTAIVLACLVLSGCNPVTRHKVLTTIFEGVPSLPPAEQLCMEYADKKVQDLRDELAGKKTDGGPAVLKTASVHRPYDEKRCDDCHDKSKEDGLVRPKKQLCAMCHPTYIQGLWVHGPTAVGECLSCHLPHNSNYVKLLKYDVTQVCSACHKETRLAEAMHNKVGAKQMNCVDCHDPHKGNSPFFLK
jgi:predicted CXXCH cytochrome family protein